MPGMIQDFNLGESMEDLATLDINPSFGVAASIPLGAMELWDLAEQERWALSHSLFWAAWGRNGPI